MKSQKNITATLLAELSLMGLTACEKGSVEKGGEAIDDAASDVADATEDAADAVKEKLDNQQQLMIWSVHLAHKPDSAIDGIMVNS